MKEQPGTAEARFEALVTALASQVGVTPPADVMETRRFGARGLKIHDKLFALLVDGRLVLKLPRQRVDAMVKAGDGDRFQRGQGRAMKEWVSVEAASGADWLILAHEALAFVESQRG